MGFLASIAASLALTFHPEAPLPKPQPVRVEAVRVEAVKPDPVRVEAKRARVPANLECPVSGRTDFDAMYVRSAAKHAVPSVDGISGACWEKARAQAESAQNPQAVSPVDARGVMQLLPGTFSDMGGTDIWDPAQNIDAGTKYSAWCYRQWSRAHDRTPEQIKPLQDACYNWGLGNVLRLQRKWGCVNWPCFAPYAPNETTTYTRRIDLLARKGEWLRH